MSDRIDLGELERAYNEATPGEWAYRVFGRPADGPTAHHIVGDDGLIAETEYSRCGWTDAAFIVAAHNQMPGLLAWVRDAREALLVELAGTDDDGPKRTANMEALLARIAAPSGAPEVPHG